jgi:hypothetical protein
MVEPTTYATDAKYDAWSPPILDRRDTPVSDLIFSEPARHLARLHAEPGNHLSLPVDVVRHQSRSRRALRLGSDLS